VRHYPHFWISTWGLRLSGTSTHLTHVLPGTHYAPLRLTLPISEHFACRARPDTLPASVCSWCPHWARDWVEAPQPRQGLWSSGPPIRRCSKETDGAPKCPSYPSGYMPRSETPVVSPPLAKSRRGLRPSGHWKPSAFPSLRL